MTTLFDLTLDLADITGEVHHGVATGGSTTTLVDSTLDDPDDYYNGGTIWFRSGNNISKTAIVTDFTNATGTITFATQTGACAAADIYAVTPKEFNRTMLRRAVNIALQDKELHYLKKDITLTGVADQLSYTMPSGVSDIRRIEVEDLINYFWKEANGYIVFDKDQEPEASDDIVVYYMGGHAEMTADSSALSVHVPPELVKWKAVIYILRQRYMVVGDDDPKVKTLLDDAQAQYAQVRRKYRPNTMPVDPHYSSTWM